MSLISAVAVSCQAEGLILIKLGTSKPYQILKALVLSCLFLGGRSATESRVNSLLVIRCRIGDIHVLAPTTPNAAPAHARDVHEALAEQV